MTPRRTARIGLLAAAALFAGASFAQMPGGPRAPGAVGPDGMGPFQGFERLHRELNLSAQQEELWKKAQGLQRDTFKTMREKAAETRARLRAEIDKPGTDLKQFAQLSDQLREEGRSQMEAAHKQVRDAWFGVYDSLDANQKEQVRVAIRDGMDRAGRRGPKSGPPHGG